MHLSIVQKPATFIFICILVVEISSLQKETIRSLIPMISCFYDVKQNASWNSRKNSYFCWNSIFGRFRIHESASSFPGSSVTKETVAVIETIVVITWDRWSEAWNSKRQSWATLAESWTISWLATLGRTKNSERH